jgi:N-acetylneuraminate synthase
MKNLIKLKSGRSIGADSSAYIIAEIGINHNGSKEIAKKLILESAKAGVDAVKFQKRDAASIMIKKILTMTLSVI